MYIETHKISSWTPGPHGAGLLYPKPNDGSLTNQWLRPEKPFKLLNPRDNGFHKPCFHRQPEGATEYFGKPYSLNTKYIVEMEDDDVIGCWVSLANGSKVWVNETVAGLTIQSNRR